MKSIIWQENFGSAVQAPLTFGNGYVISHRPNQFIVSYRPEGQHIHIGEYETLENAKSAAENHYNEIN